MRDDVTGVVPAGGQGRRMGAVDKGLVPFRGAPMAAHAIARLAPQVGAIVVNANQNADAYADRLLLDDVILFDIDSRRVRHASFGIIQKVADFIKKTPDILEISIEGHADATGTEEHNRVLSRERADSVVRLLERFGVEGSRLKAESFGRSRLKVNTQAAERANRRVEFYVTRSRIKGSSGATVPVKAPGEVTP